MNPKILSCLLFAASSSAISLNDVQAMLPKCSLGCLAQGIAQSNCGLTDYKCQCNNMGSIMDSIKPCLAGIDCSIGDLANPDSQIMDLCKSMVADNATQVSIPTVTSVVPGSGAPRVYGAGLGIAVAFAAAALS